MGVVVVLVGVNCIGGSIPPRQDLPRQKALYHLDLPFQVKLSRQGQHDLFSCPGICRQFDLVQVVEHDRRILPGFRCALRQQRSCVHDPFLPPILVPFPRSLLLDLPPGNVGQMSLGRRSLATAAVAYVCAVDCHHLLLSGGWGSRGSPLARFPKGCQPLAGFHRGSVPW